MSADFLLVPNQFKARLSKTEIAALPRILASAMQGIPLSEFIATAPVVILGANTYQAKALHRHNRVVGVNLNSTNGGCAK